MKFKRIVIIAGVVFLGILFFINPTCILYSTTGIYCPGCGSQRAMHQLLNFNILGVLQQNALYFISLFILGYHLILIGIHAIFKKDMYNYSYHPKTPMVILVFVLIFWILRNIPHYPFNLLSPN